MQPAPLEPPEPQVQPAQELLALQALPDLTALLALLVQPALKVPPGSGDQPACKGQQASVPRALRAPVLLAQLGPQERLALV